MEFPVELTADRLLEAGEELSEGVDIGAVPAIEHRREAADGLVSDPCQSLATGIGQTQPGGSSVVGIGAPFDQLGLLERGERAGDD